MRRSLAALILLAIPGAAGCSARASVTQMAAPLPAQTVSTGGYGAAPSWLPAYTPAQLALIAPVDHAIPTPARRVFPDLARFGYANNRRLDEPDEALKFTRMVVTILKDSPRFYALESMSRDVANPVVQYGPPPAAADGWSVPRRDAHGAGELVPAPAAAEARGELARGEALLSRGDTTGAVAALRAATEKSPSVPALLLAYAAALEKTGNTADAISAYRRSIAVDRTFAPAYAALAALDEKRGDHAAASKNVVEALAYEPSSAAAIALAQRLGGSGHRVAPFAIFLDVDSVGAIHVATTEGTPAQMYGGCRAVLRYEPEVRRQIFEQPADTPYYLSVVEEVICLEAALGAYAIDRQEDSDEEPDVGLDALLDLAEEDGLTGYVMFEILGQHRPERARVAPPEVHQAMVRYIHRALFGETDDPPDYYVDDENDDHATAEADRDIEEKVREAARRTERAARRRALQGQQRGPRASGVE